MPMSLLVGVVAVRPVAPTEEEAAAVADLSLRWVWPFRMTFRIQSAEAERLMSLVMLRYSEQ